MIEIARDGDPNQVSVSASAPLIGLPSRKPTEAATQESEIVRNQVSRQIRIAQPAYSARGRRQEADSNQHAQHVHSRSAAETWRLWLRVIRFRTHSGRAPSAGRIQCPTAYRWPATQFITSLNLDRLTRRAVYHRDPGSQPTSKDTRHARRNSKRPTSNTRRLKALPSVSIWLSNAFTRQRPSRS